MIVRELQYSNCTSDLYLHVLIKIMILIQLVVKHKNIMRSVSHNIRMPEHIHKTSELDEVKIGRKISSGG